MRMPHQVNRLTAQARARHWLRPGCAVILDTETTDFDGQIVEICIAEASSGQILLDTLVRPSCTINPEAIGVHHITDQMCATAPTWDQVYPDVARILSNHRLVLAYNAPFDRKRIDQECQRHQLPAPRIGWRCIMRLDATARSGQWRRLEGGHRACGDTLAARTVLCQIATRSNA